jgi:hypothetical protein
MWELIKNAVAAISAFLRIQDRRSAAANSEEMQANARAKTHAEIRDAANTAVAKNDLDEIRKQASE